MSNRQARCAAPLRSEAGAALPLVMVCIVAMLGIIGLAIDGANLFARKTQLQNVADATALACASARQTNPANCTTGANPTLFNGLNPQGFTLNATVTVACPQPWQSQCVQVTASSTWNTYFMRVVGKTNVTTTATAIAGRNNPCVLGLSGTGNNVDFVMGNGEVATVNCLIGSRSTGNASIRKSGGGTASTTVGIITKGLVSGTISSPSTMTNSTAPLNDPYAGLPTPSTSPCNGNTTISTCVSVNPGCYSNLTLSPPNGCTMNLLPGLYVITTGGLTFNTGNNRNISGVDVNFYNSRTTGAAISITGGGTVNLTARKFGPYANMLFIATSSNISIGGGANRTLNGTLYAPGGSVTVGQTGAFSTISGNIVANTISITNTLTVNDTSRIKLLQ